MLHVYHCDELLFNQWMGITIDEIRRKNLLALIAESGDKRVILAEKINTNPAYISQVLTPNDEKRRSIGDEIARRLEESYKKPHGWMDQYYATIEERAELLTDRDIHPEPDTEQQRLYEALTPEQRSSLIAAFLPTPKQGKPTPKSQPKPSEPPQVMSWTFSTKTEPLPKTLQLHSHKPTAKKKKEQQ